METLRIEDPVILEPCGFRTNLPYISDLIFASTLEWDLGVWRGMGKVWGGLETLLFPSPSRLHQNYFTTNQN